MRIYYSGGNEEISAENFIKRMNSENFKIYMSHIYNPRILSRKFPNKGNALEAELSTSDGFSWILNIGGNPIGTGYRNFLQFLKEINCKRFFGIYIINDLAGKQVGVITKGDFLKGVITLNSIKELEDLTSSQS